MNDIELANKAVSMSIQHLVNCGYQAGAAACAGIILMGLAIKSKSDYDRGYKEGFHDALYGDL